MGTLTVWSGFRNRKRWALGAAAAAVLGGLLLWFVYLPWALNWGASLDEIARAMVGDDIVRRPTFVATRAVSIHASPDRVWPWLVQIGYRRAGFYSHDWLDNDGIPSAIVILPAYQGLEQGDWIPLSESVDASVRVLEPARCMLLVVSEAQHRPWTWVWELRPADDGSTRLISRLRVEAPNLRTQLLLEYLEIVMMRKHLMGLKRRAELADATSER
jgi:hypothetical protein